jgi:hypothetical protein
MVVKFLGEIAAGVKKADLEDHDDDDDEWSAFRREDR